MTDLDPAIENCCVCGVGIDTRESEYGGDEHGVQMCDGSWACSFECWDKAAQRFEENTNA